MGRRRRQALSIDPPGPPLRRRWPAPRADPSKAVESETVEVAAAVPNDGTPVTEAPAEAVAETTPEA